MSRGQFVGRTRERETLDALLRAALEHTGQVALIAGEPGVGKTRLAEQMTDRAKQLGMVCVWGRATEDDGSPPYWPFRQVVRGLLSAPFDRPVAGTERFRLFEEVTEALITAAEPSGLLVVLDDLQWADPASLQLLTHLAAGMSTARLLVLGTYRDTERTESLQAALAGLAREPHVTRLRLTGLTEPEVAEQLETTTGWAVPESVAAAVRRRTQGNPFFVGELGALLADGRDTDGELPEGIRDAVRGRLSRLGLAAATLGRLDDAVRHLRTAATRNERAGMPPYTTISRYHLAKVLARRKRPGDREEAAALATSVAAVAAKLGMAPLRALAEALAEPAAGPLTKRERRSPRWWRRV